MSFSFFSLLLCLLVSPAGGVCQLWQSIRGGGCKECLECKCHTTPLQPSCSSQTPAPTSYSSLTTWNLLRLGNMKKNNNIGIFVHFLGESGMFTEINTLQLLQKNIPRVWWTQTCFEPRRKTHWFSELLLFLSLLLVFTKQVFLPNFYPFNLIQFWQNSASRSGPVKKIFCCKD